MFYNFFRLCSSWLLILRLKTFDNLIFYCFLLHNFFTATWLFSNEKNCFFYNKILFGVIIYYRIILTFRKKNYQAWCTIFFSNKLFIFYFFLENFLNLEFTLSTIFLDFLAKLFGSADQVRTEHAIDEMKKSWFYKIFFRRTTLLHNTDLLSH